MSTFTDPLIQETVVSRRLPSGLDLRVIPRRGQRRTFATFATHYGSIDSHFRVPSTGQDVAVPDGIAHFLEHKMFAKPDGDVFDDFGRLGASANAYTEYLTTTYLFSTTEHVEECLTVLVDFVQQPYFTKENVEKEQGIIEQEIRMYLDMPGDRLHSNLARALYQKHPARLDIAGSVESIRQITPDVLYQCYETFYHPSNMLLTVIGDVDPERILDLVADNQARKDYRPQGEIIRYLPEEPVPVAEPWVEQPMPVSLQLVALGYKDRLGAESLTGDALLRREMATGLFWNMAVGKSSALFAELYSEGLVNDRFSARYAASPTFAHSELGGESPDPHRLVDRLVKDLPHAPLTADALARQKKRELGDYMTLFNSPGDLAYVYNSLHVRAVDLFSFIPILDHVSLQDIEERRHEHLKDVGRAVSVITPAVTHA